MADPISLVGTAVGVISLGIQVCQGLYSYVDSVRGRHKDLDAASSHIQHLIRVFQSLQSLIPRLEALPNLDATTTNTLQSCINQSDEGIKELQELFNSLQDSPLQDVKGKLKNAGRALTFGLRRVDLSKMQHKVDSLVTTTELALQIINSQLGVSHNTELAELNTSIQPQLSATSQSLSHLEQKADESGARLQSIESRIETASIDILAGLESTSQNTKSANFELASQNQVNFQTLQVLLTTQHQQTQSQLATMQAAHARELSRLHLRLIEKPAVLREVCDVLTYSHVDASKRQHLQQLPLLAPVCSCGMRNRGTKSLDSTLRVGTFHAYAQQRDVSRHSKACTFYMPRKHTSVGLRFELSFPEVVSYSVDMSLSYTTGAGGFSISPKLNAVQVVKHSPAFALIDGIFNFHSSLTLPDNHHEQVAVTGNQILSLFQTGQASPHDRDIFGNTILHHLALRCSGGWDCPNVSIREKNSFNISQLFKTLIHAGAVASETGQFGRTMLDVLAKGYLGPEYSWALQSSVRTLAAEISTFFDRELFSHPDYSIGRLVTDNPALIHELDLTRLATAILLKSETDVLTILATCPHSIFERFSALTVLHLSSDWPMGLSILLSAGASMLVDEKSKYDQTALDLALYFRCEEAVQILLNHGSVWNPSQVPWPRGTSFECSRRLAGSLAERRRRLFSIAKQTLAADELEELRILDGGFPDSETYSVIQKLFIKGVHVPIFLTVPVDYEGVYLHNVNIHHFPAFLEFGFSNMNERNRQGLLPINIAPIGAYLRFGVGDMQMSFISPNILSWLFQHSCLNQSVIDPLFWGFNTSATALHFLTLRLIKDADILQLELKSEFSELTAWLNNFLSKAFEAPTNDDCNCWCSADGCSPFNIYLKALVDYEDVSELLGSEYFSLDPDCSIICWETLAHVSADLIRFLTFEALEMTHTCCAISEICVTNTKRRCRMLMQFPGHVEEIQDEEKALGERLETLVQEFESRLAQSHESLTAFIFGYWRDRMASECVPSFEKSDHIAQVGICVDETYETPIALRNILGRGFDFPPHDEESDAEQSESESESETQSERGES
ncbi:hypothetical protein B0J13DRAFT_557494 [Dactylonectria estremocensis]|uniref:Fungal N-terminal domain-containing protein n=1 Tax=Dactylonectria estremocensis TaxID=1079267 RepID=A0A9P9J3V5_9HYPO|nr:hypothetical protein B0J13DRAFT_557494 [Dactylonectria estremocensis]